MKVRVTEVFQDKITLQHHDQGEIFEASDSRCKELLALGLVEKVTERKKAEKKEK